MVYMIETKAAITTLVHLIYFHINRKSTKAFRHTLTGHFQGYSRAHAKWTPITEARDEQSGHRPVHTMTVSPNCFLSMGLLQQVPSEHHVWWNVASSSSFNSPFLVSFTHLFKIVYLSVETVVSVSLSLSITMDVYQWTVAPNAAKLATSVCTVLTGKVTSSPPSILLCHDLNAVYTTLHMYKAGYNVTQCLTCMKKIHFGEYAHLISSQIQDKDTRLGTLSSSRWKPSARLLQLHQNPPDSILNLTLILVCLILVKLHCRTESLPFFFFSVCRPNHGYAMYYLRFNALLLIHVKKQTKKFGLK